MSSAFVFCRFLSAPRIPSAAGQRQDVFWSAPKNALWLGPLNILPSSSNASEAERHATVLQWGARLQSVLGDAYREQGVVIERVIVWDNGRANAALQQLDAKRKQQQQAKWRFPRSTKKRLSLSSNDLSPAPERDTYVGTHPFAVVICKDATTAHWLVRRRLNDEMHVKHQLAQLRLQDDGTAGGFQLNTDELHVELLDPKWHALTALQKVSGKMPDPQLSRGVAMV